MRIEADKFRDGGRGPIPKFHKDIKNDNGAIERGEYNKSVPFLFGCNKKYKCCFVPENAHMDIYQRLCTVKLFIAADTLCSECRRGFILVSCIMDRAYKNIWRAEILSSTSNIQLCIRFCTTKVSSKCT